MGFFLLSQGLTFFLVERLVPPIVRDYPSTFEMLDLAYGYMWYRKILNESTTENDRESVQLLDLGHFRDRAYVYVDEVSLFIVYSLLVNK